MTMSAGFGDIATPYPVKEWGVVWDEPGWQQHDLTGLQERFPALYPFRLENEFHEYWSLHLRQMYWVPWALSAIYVLLVLYVGPYLMRNRAPWQVGTSLRYWNLFLAVFSFLGMCRTVPHLLALLWQVGWRRLNCDPASVLYGYGASGFWTMLFVHSKYVEFVDTFFLIVRKKPVSLLHWYHHASVLLYSWHASMHETPSGIVFVAMNYTVHALMYYYYFLTASKIFPKWAHVVTKCQILQMIFGIGTTCSALAFYLGARAGSGGKAEYIVMGEEKNADIGSKNNYRCSTPPENLLFAGGIYLSYFLLFAQFYLQKYKKARTAEKEQAGKKQEAAETEMIPNVRVVNRASTVLYSSTQQGGASEMKTPILQQRIPNKYSDASSVSTCASGLGSGSETEKSPVLVRSQVSVGSSEDYTGDLNKAKQQ
ncbi:unnamed protein product [Amoebophrya sp. A120]|nr:unnamed protein product [Amoebophrya sp. A120]|eukprot:GSA120T00005721001.1